MRSNPYGAAAGAVGGSGVVSLCLAALTGPFGVVQVLQSWPQEGYDGEEAAVCALFHAPPVASAPGALATGAVFHISRFIRIAFYVMLDLYIQSEFDHVAPRNTRTRPGSAVADSQ